MLSFHLLNSSLIKFIYFLQILLPLYFQIPSLDGAKLQWALLSMKVSLTSHHYSKNRNAQTSLVSSLNSYLILL
jgi:hypothetical protein